MAEYLEKWVNFLGFQWLYSPDVLTEILYCFWTVLFRVGVDSYLLGNFFLEISTSIGPTTALEACTSRHHAGPALGPPWNPSYSTVLLYRMGPFNWVPILSGRLWKSYAFTTAVLFLSPREKFWPIFITWLLQFSPCWWFWSTKISPTFYFRTKRKIKKKINF